MTKRKARNAKERTEFREEHRCAQCQAVFERHYRMNATRKAKPQFCSLQCNNAYKQAKSDAGIADRFWTKVNRRGPDDCWEWQGFLGTTGYGHFRYQGKAQTASRVAYWLHTGQSPGEMSVCHTCDNPPCCNPSHLWLGTPKENGHDRERKGRGRRNPLRGTEHPQSKLTPELALEAYHSKEPSAAIARRLGITSAAVYRIKRGLSWAHVTGAGNG